MISDSQNAKGEDHPLVFVSSFSRELEGYASQRESPLWQLRQDLAALNEDAAFRNSLPLIGARRLTWVTEKAEPNLVREGNELAGVDRLVEVLRNSELYVCVLADRRRDTKEHGSPIPVHGADTAVSYFEIELYAAAMYRKEISLYVLEGFDPGDRLLALLKILEWAIPDLHRKPQKAKDILAGIRERIRCHCSSPSKAQLPLRERLVEAFCRVRMGPFSPRLADRDLLFLNGTFENRPLPQPERIEVLIKEYRKEMNFQKKLTRIWFAVRELMPASYQPADVHQNSDLKKFLPFRDCVLEDWAGAASWHRWHGHLYAGTVAPLNSQVLVRSQSFRRHGDLQPEVVLTSDGGLASAYYNIAKVMGPSVLAWKCLRRAGQHVKRAIEARAGPTDNLLAIRGSIRLRMGYWPGAVSDFKEMLRLRESAGAPPQKIADALMHLGHAYAFCPLLGKGWNLLKESVEIFKGYPSDPNLARARRKLATAYKLAGQFALAEETRRQAESDAKKTAADDQLDR